MDQVNKDMIQGSWNELKGKAMKQWSKLTENDFTELKGNVQELKGKIQKLYGYSKEQLENEFAKFMPQAARTANAGLNRVNGAIDEAEDKASDR